MRRDAWTEATLSAAQPIRAGAFVITLFGDAITPRGGQVWIGNIIETCAGVGISETLVRTAVSRLVTAGVLTSNREGRRSYYRLAPRLESEFDMAGRRLFDPPPAPRDWLLVATSADDDDLAAQGYVRLASGLMLGPCPEGDLPGGAILRGQGLGGSDLQGLTARLWGLHDLAQGWQAFCGTIAPVIDLPPPSPEDSLIARLCLIHAFRRLVLATPILPEDAFPADWPSTLARSLFARAYLALSPNAETRIATRFEHAAGPLSRDSAQGTARLAALSRWLDHRAEKCVNITNSVAKFDKV